eukprot:5517826-Prymnesium_polylepis.2
MDKARGRLEMRAAFLVSEKALDDLQRVRPAAAEDQLAQRLEAHDRVKVGRFENELAQDKAVEEGRQVGERAIDSRMSIELPAHPLLRLRASPSRAVRNGEAAHIGNDGKEVAKDAAGVRRREVSTAVARNERVDRQVGEPQKRSGDRRDRAEQISPIVRLRFGKVGLEAERQLLELGEELGKGLDGRP